MIRKGHALSVLRRVFVSEISSAVAAINLACRRTEWMEPLATAQVESVLHDTSFSRPGPR
jgi:hypothetical protein